MASTENNSQESLSREMTKAVSSGDVQKVKDIIAKYGLSHCEEWSDGFALLRDAVRFDKPDVARFLIEAGAPLTNSEKHISILHHAVKKTVQRFSPIVKLLLQKGASVNAKDKYGSSPLHGVTTVGMARVLLTYAKTPPDLNATNSEGLTPLHLAVRYPGNVPLAQLYLERGADVNFRAKAGKHRYERGYELFTPLHLATNSGNSSAVSLLLQSEALVNLKCKKGTALHIACKKAVPDVVTLLLEHGADVEATDEKGRTPIYRAIKHVDSHAVIVQSLLDKGAVLKPSPGLLHDALSKKCPELIDILIKHGCDVNERVKGHTCLHSMVSASHFKNHGAKALEIVRLLLANGADVNGKTEKKGATALSRAIRYELYEVVPILLDYGAEYQIPPSGDTLLHLCARASRDVSAKTFKALLKRKGGINARNAFGETPLHLAAVKEQCTFEHPTEALLSWPDVEIDARDKDGSTALSRAAAGLCYHSVSTLLSYGADVNIPNNEGLTPVQIVEQYRATPSRRTCRLLLCVSMDLRRHIAKLKCAELPVSEANLMACRPTRYHGEKVSYDPDHYTWRTLDDPDYVKKCKGEVERTKRRIGSSWISHYDILSGSCQQVAIYTKNAAVSRAMKSEESIKKFREYGRMIDFRYLRAKRRVQLEKTAVSSLSAMFEFLPQICIYMIIDFLSNEDLKNCSDCYPGLDD